MLIRTVVGLTTTIGVQQVVKNIVVKTADLENLTKIQRITTSIGGATIGMYAGSVVANHMENYVEEVTNSVKKIFKKDTEAVPVEEC